MIRTRVLVAIACAAALPRPGAAGEAVQPPGAAQGSVPQPEAAGERVPPGDPVAFSDLPGFDGDDHLAALLVFRASCTAMQGDTTPSRAAQQPPAALVAACRQATGQGSGPGRIEDEAGAKAFFETRFQPRRLTGPAFFTGYYEPAVEGSLTPAAGFTAPLLGRPAGLVVADPGTALPGLDPTLRAGRRTAGGGLAPMPDRAAIEAGALGAAAPPLVWLRDRVDAFFAQVQGSVRVTLPDGSVRRLAYAGRNGYPYTSVGRVLVKRLGIPPERMGMAELKAWIKAHGEAPDRDGGRLMAQNRSFIFFRFDDTLPPSAGPVGGEGISLTALRSIAVDRSIWPYGLPFYADAALPWRSETATPFRRLLVAQDTGSAILGAARADLFFGTGGAAAAAAGRIRQPGSLFVLWPKADPVP